MEQIDRERIIEDMAVAVLGLDVAANELTFRSRWRRLSTLGILGIHWERSELVTHTLAQIEGLGRGGCPQGLCYALASQLFGMQFPMQSWLTAIQSEMLFGITTGERILCHALTEDAGGSDPFSMQTYARALPDGSWRLHGEKKYITAAPVADVAVVFAKTDSGRHPFSLSAFLVDLSAPGVSRSDAFAKVVLHDVPMGALTFNNVALAPWQIIGELGAGFPLLSATTTWERGLLLGYTLGYMHRTLEQCVHWSNQRQHFSRRMSESHQVAARLSDMAMLMARSRSLLYDVARQLDTGVPARSLSSLAAITKISVSEDFDHFSRHAAQLFGVRAFIGDSNYFVDLAAPSAAKVYAGVNDLLRISIAHQLGATVDN